MRTLLTILIAFCSLTMSAQDTYRQTLAQLLSVTNKSITEESLSKPLKQVATQQLPDLSTEQIDRLTSRYFKEQFTTDLAELTEQYYRSNVSEEEMKEYLAAINSPEGKSALQHSAELQGGMEAKIQKLITPDIQGMIQGKTPTPVAVSPDIPDSYKTKFQDYYKLAGIDKIIENLFTTIEQAMSAQQSDSEQSKKFVSDFLKYLKDSMYPMMINVCSESMTEPDLQFYIDLMNGRAGKHVLAAGVDSLKDPTALATQLVEKYTEWMLNNK